MFGTVSSVLSFLKKLVKSEAAAQDITEGSDSPAAAGRAVTQEGRSITEFLGDLIVSLKAHLT